MLRRFPPPRARTQPAALTDALRGVLATIGWALATFVGGLAAHAQAPQATATATNQIPEPIHWKQELFLIPYEWSPGVESGAAQAVWLMASKDRGATWQKTAEAQPHVKAFNYRAEGDGEYWFAVRTIDTFGRAWPAGPYQPELRVIVDTSVPRIDALHARIRGDGALEVEWRATDPHLDAASWRIEVQADGTGTWDPVSVPESALTAPGLSVGKAAWFPPPDRQPVAARATVFDLAGNSADARVEIAPAPLVANAAPEVMASQATAPGATGWESASADFAGALRRSSTDYGLAAMPAAPAPSGQPAPQPWPADVTTRGPFRLSGDAARLATDGVTRYGYPAGVGSPSDGAGVVGSDEGPSEERAARSSAVVDGLPAFTPLEPFRQASLRRLPPTKNMADPFRVASREDSRAQVADTAEGLGQDGRPMNSLEPKRVGSRTFALEYELEDVGRWGVSRVELWGTRNGGDTWRRYAEDDDLRSPLRVTVEEEGLYGFRILVESAGGLPAAMPQPGDEPELWVEVDLHRPLAELTAVEPGSGNQADHLLLRWRAEDDNLPPRPISLFYSSRPAGPWSVIATSLENTGVYAWRVERHVPERCYLRLEVRDMAGNLAAFQTLEPVVREVFGQPTARIRSVAP